MRGKWLRSLGILVIPILLIAAGCSTGSGTKQSGSTQPPATNTPAPQQETKPVVIGATLPLTGAFADTAKWAKAGYEEWGKDVNSRGGLLGRKVELKLIDDEGKVDKGVQLLEKLISVDKVDLILGGYPGNIVAAQAPVAEKYKFLYVGMGGHGPSFSQGFQYFFGGPPLMADWYPLAYLEWVKSLPGDKRPTKFGLISINNVIGQGARNTIGPWLKANMPEAKIVMDELHDSPLPSADSLAAKVKQNGVEALLITNNLQDSAQILRALKAQNYQPKSIWSGIGPSVPEWSKELGSLGENVTTGAPAHGAADLPGIKKLNEISLKTFNLPANPYFIAFFNYGAVIEGAVGGTKSLDSTKLRDFLRSSAVETPLGAMKFDAKGLPAPISYLLQVQGGTAKLVWPRQAGAPDVIYPMPAWK